MHIYLVFSMPTFSEILLADLGLIVAIAVACVIGIFGILATYR